MLEQGMLTFALLGAGWVLWLLVAMSIGVLAISAERALFLVRDGSNATRLGQAVNAFLGGGERSAFQAELSGIGGLEARILSAGAEAGVRGAEAADKAMTGTAIAEKLKMERGLAFIATVGANAPFVGLFGTVLGIIQAFHDLSLESDEASTAVMAGISEALVATAVGLLVAIPAVVLYNAFTRWVKGRMGRSESLKELVLSRLAEAPASAKE